MTVPAQPTQTPDDGGSTTPAPDSTAPATPADSQAVDLKTLDGDQLNQVLENPNLWNTPRLKQLREEAPKAKKLEEAQSKAEEAALKEQNKWKELAEKREQETLTYKQKVQEGAINQALSIKLFGDKVVDVDGALKLIDRSNISVDENGQLVGVEDALEALKKDRPYLFSESGSQAPVGSPSNPSSPSAGQPGRYKFKESQLTGEFYRAHKAEIDEAGRLGQIEQDGPPSTI